MPIQTPGVPQPLATTDSPTFAGINITGTTEQELATDFATTGASAAAVEYLFTAVPVTSGKTYIFDGELWLKWATAATSGSADLYEISAEGPLTVDVNLSRFVVTVEGSGGSGGFGNSMQTITASAALKCVTFNGRFKATSSDHFNIGLNIPAWDSGDVVTVMRGARLRVRQVG